MRYVSQHKGPLLVGLVMLALALGVGTAVALRGDHAVAASRTDASLETARVQAVSPAISAMLSSLSRSQTGADALPPSVEQRGWITESRYGANRQLARRVASSPTGGSVYLIPSQLGVCMLNLAGTENLCASPSEVEAGEASEAVLCAPASLPTNDIEIGGILPDGTQNPKAILSNGATTPLRVEGNTYIADFARSGALPTAIAWESSDGRQHTAATHVPPGVASEDCVAPPSSNAS